MVGVVLLGFVLLVGVVLVFRVSTVPKRAFQDTWDFYAEERARAERLTAALNEYKAELAALNNKVNG
jgi:hypothetical protein